jgi:hypothetical protein
LTFYFPGRCDSVVDESVAVYSRFNPFVLRIEAQVNLDYLLLETRTMLFYERVVLLSDSEMISLIITKIIGREKGIAVTESKVITEILYFIFLRIAYVGDE